MVRFNLRHPVLSAHSHRAGNPHCRRLADWIEVRFPEKVVRVRMLLYLHGKGTAWFDDGTALTFKHRFTQSPAFVASFYPFTAEHITRFIAQHRGNPHFSARTIGTTKQGRDLRMYTITDTGVTESEKRVIMFTALQHDLETTGAAAAWVLRTQRRN